MLFSNCFSGFKERIRKKKKELIVWLSSLFTSVATLKITVMHLQTMRTVGMNLLVFL